MSDIIIVENLKKSFGSVQAVKGISFNVERGSLFAFLGTNGAGKSTTIDILSTLLKKDSGNIFIDELEIGKKDYEIRKKIGVVFQNGVLDDLLTVKENLEVRGRFYGLSGTELKERINYAVKITEAEEILNRRYGNLSGGQKRRVDIARALLNNPEILFLDEPTTGLDPKTRQSIWSTISDMQKSYGMTVFLTTHYMEEAAQADKIAIISSGSIIASDTPNEMKEKYTHDALKIYNPDEMILKYCENNKLQYIHEKDRVEISLKSSVSAIRIIEELENNITSFEVIHGNLDDVFLNVTEGGTCDDK